MIDLTFINILFVENKVYYNLDNDLDYFTIVITIPDNSIMPD